LYKKI